MPWLATLAAAAALLALLERWRRTRVEGLGLDALVLQGALWLLLLGMAGTALALLGWFRPGPLALVLAALAGACWPWGHTPRPWQPTFRFRVLGVIAVLLIGVGLRLPPMTYPLGGRDQGTYLLRAHQVARTGTLVHRDPVLAMASAEADQRAGPADLLGLYPLAPAKWREGLYEGPYRPGFYLTDRQRGLVAPQFLHLHPILLAIGHVVIGPGHAPWVVTAEAALALLAMIAVGRRLLGWPWGLLAALVFALQPLTIWVARNTLTETMTALLLLSAALSALRTRAGPVDELPVSAFLLGGIAWLRGNAWLMAPLILLVLWLRPPGPRGARWKAPMVFLLMVLTSVGVHADSSFPYLYDELARLLPLQRGPRPTTILLVASGGALLWILVDRGLQAVWRSTPTVPRWVAHRAPPMLALATLAVAGYAAMNMPGPAPPFRRLAPIFPVLGPVLLMAAGAGLAIVTIRLRLRWTPSTLWLLAMASMTVATAGLYAHPALPSVDLYYYGRYLVPEIVPALCFLAVVPVAELWRGLAHRPAVAYATVGLSAALLVHPIWILIAHPITRLREFDGAEAAIDWLARRIPEDAIVIAGGEGWHHGHTFNQIGGALAMSHGRQVLPYVTKEAAYATMYELLVAGPRAHHEPPPPVYLLINEATRARMPGEKASNHPIAAIDDLLPAPFTAREMGLFELYLHRLTPVRDRIPTRVTRDELRLGLMRVGVDALRADQVLGWRFIDGEIIGPAPLELHDAHWEQGQLCVPSGRAMRIRLPRALGPGPRSVVLVARPGTASSNHRWRIHVDGRTMSTTPVRRQPREQDTLGPFVVDHAPQGLRIRAPKPTGAPSQAPCPQGALGELRILPPDRPQLSPETVDWAVTIAPAADLGHPYRVASWVSGRGLSRLRPGIRPRPRVHGPSLVLTADAPLRFPSANLPRTDDSGLEIVLTLTRSELGPEARIALLAGDEPIAVFDPPDQRDRTWQSKPVPWQPQATVASLRLELHGTRNPGDFVDVRDIGLFSRSQPVVGRLLLR